MKETLEEQKTILREERLKEKKGKPLKTRDVFWRTTIGKKTVSNKNLVEQGKSLVEKNKISCWKNLKNDD